MERLSKHQKKAVLGKSLSILHQVHVGARSRRTPLNRNAVYDYKERSEA